MRDVSHELVTPLAIAYAIAQSMRMSDGGRIDPGDLDALLEELDRAVRIARRVVGTPDAQDWALVRVPVDIEEMMVRLTERWRRMADRVWTVDVGVSAAVHADVRRLEAALDAIVENAIKATDPADHVAITTRVDDRAVVIEVADSGVGIATQALPRVLDRARSDGYGPGGARGSGLGLALVDAIAEAHGGSVGLQTLEGRGTTVSLRIPTV
jgi:signal transduction histidine kinase